MALTNKYSRTFTDTAKRKTYSQTRHRLEVPYVENQDLKLPTSAALERIALNYLLKIRPQGYSLLMYIKYSQLGLDARNSAPESIKKVATYATLSKTDKKIARMLKENMELVRIVLDSVFQWFGTTLGRDELRQLLQILDEYEYDESENRLKKLQRKQLQKRNPAE